jgi:hypothetical protein
MRITLVLRSFVLLLLLAPCALHADTDAHPGGTSSGGSGRSRGGHLGKGVLRPGDFERQTSVSHTEVTESPTTHKKGQWWAEAGLVGYSRDASDSLRTENAEFAPLSAGYAFTDRFEVTATGTPIGLDRVRDLSTNVLTHNTSTAALGVHAKSCWIGSDTTAFSMGSSFTVSEPARTDTTSPGVELAVRVPVAIALPGEVTLGAMVESALRNDPDGLGHHGEYLESLALSRDLAPGLSGFVEVLHVSSTLVGQPSLSAFDLGLDWTPVPHLGVGIGGSLGSSGGHSDDGVFGGISLSR